MKKYFFGYLFVRIAKLIAVVIALAGLGYGLFKLEQASLSAQSVSYQPSGALRQSLDRLTATLADSQGLVAAFAEQNGGPAHPAEPAVPMPGELRADDDFARLGVTLENVERQRRQLKETLVTRFDALVESIQAKLRAHAEAVAPTPPPPDAAATTTATVPAPAPRPVQPTPEQAETLYTGQISNFDIQERTSVLDHSKEFLKVLESSAEDPNNRKSLTDSVAQLDALSRLLPSKIEVPTATAEEPPPPARASSSYVPAPRPKLNAQKVADQLAQLRGSVRQAMLTSWTLDAAYAQASDLAAIERGKCRLATLALKGIWLSAFGQLGSALLLAVFVAFLVLVMADLTQTLLDTATNTGVTADAAKRAP